MRRKRFKHVAQNLCQMFCGWRLNSCKRQLVQCGTGVLEIDVLSAACVFNGKPTASLSIAGEMKSWLEEELARDGIPAHAIETAHLRADLRFSEIPWRERTTREQFFHAGQSVRTETMHRCLIRCEGAIVTDEATYRGKYDDVEEWPLGWPAL